MAALIQQRTGIEPAVVEGARVRQLARAEAPGAFIKWLKWGNMGELHMELYRDGVLVDDDDAGLPAGNWSQGTSGVETNADFVWTVPDLVGKQNLAVKITPTAHPELAKTSA